MRIDPLDRRLLREIQLDNSRSADQLAEACASTTSTVLRRLARLRAAGIIQREVALIDGAAVGQGLLMFVRVRLDNDDWGTAKTFTEQISAHPNVIQFFLVTGSSDYIMLLSISRMEELATFVESNLIANPKVVLSETQVVIRTHKMGGPLPIPDGEFP